MQRPSPQLACAVSQAGWLVACAQLWHEFNQRVKRMKVFMWQHKLDQHLQNRLATWMDYQWATSRGINVKEILDSLPDTLNQQAHTHSLTTSCSAMHAILGRCKLATKKRDDRPALARTTLAATESYHPPICSACVALHL